MTAVGEIIGISVGLGVVALGVVYASVLKWKAEDRKERAHKKLEAIQQRSSFESNEALNRKIASSPPALLLNFKADNLPIGRMVDIESSWGQLAKQVKLVSYKQMSLQASDGTKQVITFQVNENGVPKSIGPILIDPATQEVLGVKFKVYS